MIEKFQSLEVRGRKSSKPWKFFAVLFPMLGSLAMAQGPGSLTGFFQAVWGVKSGNLWTPNDMPSINGWWTVTDIDTISVVAGTNRVSGWNDKSTNGYNFTQTDSARRPFYRNDVVTGLPVIDMTDALATRTFLTLSSNIGGSNTFYALVYRKVTTGNSIVLIDSGSTFDYLQYGNSWYVGQNIQTVGINTNGFELRSAYTGTAGSTNVVRYSNTVAQASTAYTSQLGFRSLGNSATVQTSDIAVRELVSVRGNPDLADRQKLEGYLAWNNDIVDKLPVDHPYKNSPPRK
jgi:hypothetical protein